MIVKYLNNGVWGYIDNVRQAATKDIDGNELIKAYNDDIKYKDESHAGEKDVASWDDSGNKVDQEICLSNKIFLKAIEEINNESDNAHAENLIDGSKYINENWPAAVILLYLNDHKEYDRVALVTNQKVFLMNDKGQTIERLV